jgi:hypothetical protein
MKSGKSARQSQFGPLQKKTFASALDRFFEEQCPQLGGHLTRQVIVNTVQSLVEEFYPPHTHLRMGQVMWPAAAVDENETAAYGKSIEKTKLKPVFVDMIAPEDIEAMLNGEKAKLIRQRAAVRLFEQAKEQQAVFTGVDVATMMRLSPATISNYVRDWENKIKPAFLAGEPSMTWAARLPIKNRSVTKLLWRVSPSNKLHGKPIIPRRPSLAM